MLHTVCLAGWQCLLFCLLVAFKNVNSNTLVLKQISRVHFATNISFQTSCQLQQPCVAPILAPACSHDMDSDCDSWSIDSDLWWDFPATDNCPSDCFAYHRYFCIVNQARKFWALCDTEHHASQIDHSSRYLNIITHWPTWQVASSFGRNFSYRVGELGYKISQFSHAPMYYVLTKPGCAFPQLIIHRKETFLMNITNPSFMQGHTCFAFHNYKVAFPFMAAVNDTYFAMMLKKVQYDNWAGMDGNTRTTSIQLDHSDDEDTLMNLNSDTDDENSSIEDDFSISTTSSSVRARTISSDNNRNKPNRSDM